MIAWPLSTNPPPGAWVTGIRDWALKLRRHRRLCEILPSPLIHVIKCPGMQVTLVALLFTSSCHLCIPLAALWSTEPTGHASSPSCNLICLDPLDIPSVLWSWGFRICLCSCIAQWVPKRTPLPLLPLLWVLRSGQCVEITPDLHATAAEKRGPFDQLQQHRCSPP